MAKEKYLEVKISLIIMPPELNPASYSRPEKGSQL